MKCTHSPASSTPPIDLVLDTDMGNDIDDALALAMIHSLQSRGECRLLGVAVSKDNPLAPVYVDAVNTFYGRGTIPIGMVRGGVTPDDRTFIRPVTSAMDNDSSRYPRTYEAGEYPEAVGMLRRLLAGRPDRSVTLLMIGFSTNLARLLDSGPDASAAVDGATLFAQKVGRVVAMAGNFSEAVQANPTLETREYNVHRDIASAQRFFHRCPAPILFSGYEIGEAMLFPPESIVNDFGWATHHPVAEAYLAYMPMPYERPTWDLTAVLAAVRPVERYFGVSPRGRVAITDDGIMRFRADRRGPHRHLVFDPALAGIALADMVQLCAQPMCTKTRSTAGATCDGRCQLRPSKAQAGERIAAGAR